MRRAWVSVTAVIAILLVGTAGMLALRKLKKRPAETVNRERPIHVEAVLVQPEDVPVTITGYGEVRTLNTVTISPEVSGKIVEINPDLEVGGIIRKGESLFVIDQSTYKAQLADARAQVIRWKNSIKRLETELASDGDRLKTLERSRDLARAEFERVKRLLEQNQIGTRSAVDSAEQAYNTVEDQVDQLARALAVYPIEIEEAKNSLASAQAQLDTAEINLARTRVAAPFDARVKSVQLEKDQYVVAGTEAVTLADDSVLEMSVSLDSRDARQWLRFNGERLAPGSAWFSELEPVTCTIRWTEDKEGHHWEGVLHRVEKFDQTSRTLTVAIRLEGTSALSRDVERLPLVEGMFCSVEIPGRTMVGVFRLPRWAVSFENAVYLAVDERLKTTPVQVARAQADEVFISGGLEPGDIVVTTRLVNPLENSLLNAILDTGEETGS